MFYNNMIELSSSVDWDAGFGPKFSCSCSDIC